MTQPQQPDIWRKASYSSQSTNCVELNGSLDAVRDSKNGDTLRLDRRAVAALLATAKRNR